MPASPPLPVEKCEYCHEIGHLILVLYARTLKCKEACGVTRKVQFVASRNSAAPLTQEVEPAFKAFVFSGSVLLSETDVRHPVIILWDTGAAKSFLLEGIASLYGMSACGTNVLVKGVDLCMTVVPLDNVLLTTPDFTGFICVAVQPHLPVPGISFILGNDIVIEEVVPLPKVVPEPMLCSNDVAVELPKVFSACVFTYDQRRKFADIDLTDTFMSDSPSNTPSLYNLDTPVACPIVDSPELPSTREALVKAQGADPSLESCHYAVIKKSNLKNHPTAYYLRGCMLMCKWTPPDSPFD